MSRWKNTRMCLLDFCSLKLLHIWRKDGPKPETHAQTLFRCFIPNIRHTWSLDPNAELPSLCLAISKAWQTSPWECQSRTTVGSGSHAMFQRAFIGGIFYVVLLLEVKSQLPGSEKWWLGLILGFLQSWYHTSLKNSNVYCAHIPMWAAVHRSLLSGVFNSETNL